MKTLSWIVSLIIMVATLAPCKDTVIDRFPTTTTNISKTYTSHNPIDTCSPFCVCACCNTPAYLKQIVVSLNIQLKINKEYSEQYSGNTIAAPFSIWQPPKLG